jgi:hypothetical protein
MANHFKQGYDDVAVGYRLNKIEEKFEEFLQKLTGYGAELIFTFKKTQTKETDFKSNREEEYTAGIYVVDQIASASDFKSLVKRIKPKKREHPYNHSVMLVLCQVADRFGKLYGLDSINSRPSTSQVQLANKYNALAIMGLNTHYIFYSGTWAFWSDADLDMRTMTIRQYNREKILKSLNVTFESAALFSTLAGSLYSTEEIVERMTRFFGSRKSRDFFPDIAHFVNNQRFPISDTTINSIILQIFGQRNQQIFDDFKRTLQMMEPNTCSQLRSNIDPEVMKYFKDDYANLAEEILEGSSIYISPVYLDLR